MPHKLYPKDFIKIVFLDELKSIAFSNPYIAFPIMAIGIEFFGKCLESSEPDWNKYSAGKPKKDFIRAIDSLVALSKYRPHKELLVKDLRNGFAHTFAPQRGLTLSSKDEEKHMVLDPNGRLNLRCEDFYSDFECACHEIINTNFPDVTDKMNLPFLEIPGPSLTISSGINTAVTQSLA